MPSILNLPPKISNGAMLLNPGILHDGLILGVPFQEIGPRHFESLGRNIFTWSASPSFVNSPVGQAINIGGNSLTSINNTSIKVAPTTASFWFNAQTLASYNAFFSISSGVHDFSFYLNVSGKFVVYSGGVSIDPTTSTGTINTKQWYHCVVTQDGTTLNVYVNGTLFLTAAYAPTGTFAGTFSFGTAGGNTFNGYFTKFYLWSRILSVPEIQALYQYPLKPFKTNHYVYNPAVVSLNLSASDSFTFADGSAGAGLYLIIPQGLGNVYFAGFRDFITLSDAIKLFANYTLQSNDSITLSDFISALLNINLPISDSITLSDNVTTQLNALVTLNLSVGDSIALLDKIDMTGPFITFTDTLNLQDSVNVVLESTLRSYIRRYLNDVV